MPRAVLKNGVIYPVDPLPPEWADGKELWVEEPHEPGDNLHGEDHWLDELDAMVAENDAEDFKKLEDALREADQQAKEWVRREMGLP
jgi:hypothetical protein